MEESKELSECCYKAVFANPKDKTNKYTARRLGRCHYICDWCGADISMLMAMYWISKMKDT